MNGRGLLMLALGLLFLGAQTRGVEAGPAEQPAPATDEAAPSPHADPAACAVCHGEGVPDELPQGMQVCLDCHPDADMHPVGVKPETTNVPEGWPLSDGAVACQTCHAEPGCDAERSKEAPWLRGGPVFRSALFCVRCHDAEELRRVDPHHPREPDAPSDPSCVACHHGKPEEGASPADSMLRTAPNEICQECHGKIAHLGADTHLGKEPKVTQGPLDGALHLDAGGLIQCWTCHDAHGSAVERAARVRPRRARRAAAALRALARPDYVDRYESFDPGHPPLLALPATGDRLCRACHGDGG